MKAYVTKYCLTGPIIETELAEKNIEPPFSWVRWPNGMNGTLMVRDSEWADSEEGALIQAERRRKRKIESLKKSIAKMEQRKFVIEPAKD